MNPITVKEIVKVTGGTLLMGKPGDVITGVKHDSRECGADDLFVAIIGENQDAHKYVGQVLENGCRAVLVSREGEWLKQAEALGAAVVLVEDTVYAMGELAKYYLDTLNVKKIAVTGSVGKTSVRDMIYYVVNEKYRCGRNLKNFNNFIGLPLSIFQFDDSLEVVVLEMGMSDFGEIDRLASIVKPHIGVITNIGVAHMESLGSREGIFQAKMEIAKHIAGDDELSGTLIYASDSEFLTKEKTKGNYDQISIGEKGKDDYIISSVDDFGMDGIKFTLEHAQKVRQISLPLPGRHNAINSALAVAVGDLLGISPEEETDGLAAADLTGNRLKRRENCSIYVIDDTYNASPDSMKSALRVLEHSRCDGKKIAILGDMYELGEDSDRQHFGVGLFAGGLKIDTLIAIGTHARKICEGADGGNLQTAYYEKKEDFYQDKDRFIENGDIILVKGSRGMKMEQVVENILKQ